MGEIAEMMLDGTLCERCGGVVDGTTPGHPRLCDACEMDDEFDLDVAIGCIRRLCSDVLCHLDKKQIKKFISQLYNSIKFLKECNK